MTDTITTCNLCGQSFQLKDRLLSVRKKRHEDHHDPTKPHGSDNQTWGKVTWS